MLITSKLLFLAFLGILSHVPEGHALEAILRGTLPAAQHRSAAVYDGDNGIYILGGQLLSWWNGQDSNQILRFDLTTNTVEQVGQFPFGLKSGAAAIDRDGQIFYFGGQAASALQSTVWKMALDSPTPVLVGTLPTPLGFTTTAFDGVDGIYVVGGIIAAGAVKTRDILNFNTTSNAIEVVAQLPAARSSTAATWAQGAAYIFGGSTDQYSGTTDIFSLTSTQGNENVESLMTQLVTRSYDAIALTVGDDIYVVSGNTGTGETHQLTRFNTVTQAVESFSVDNFPITLSGASAVYVEKLNRIYVFGGLNVFQELTDAILSIDL